jgi:hypothetical protein
MTSISPEPASTGSASSRPVPVEPGRTTDEPGGTARRPGAFRHEPTGGIGTSWDAKAADLARSQDVDRDVLADRVVEIVARDTGLDGASVLDVGSGNTLTEIADHGRLEVCRRGVSAVVPWQV